MKKHLLKIIIYTFLTFIITSCSMLNPIDYCDVQFQIPKRTASTSNSNTEIWHIEFSETSTGNIFLINSYKPGETIFIDNVPAGNYTIKIFGSDGESIYTNITNTKVVPGTVNNVNVVLNNLTNIKQPLSKIGTISEIQGLKNPNHFYYGGNKYGFYISRYYVFNSFNSDFANYLNSFDISDFSSYTQQKGDYTIDPANKYAIEVTAVLDYKTLKLNNYIIAIRNNDISPNGYLYNWISPDDFETLTDSAKRNEMISLKQELKTALDKADSKIINLAKEGSKVIETFYDKSLVLAHYDNPNYLYHRRLYVFDSYLNEHIQQQLQERTSNCHFHFDVTNYLENDPANPNERKNAFVQVEARYNKKDKKIDCYEIRLCDKKPMPYGSYGPGYSMQNMYPGVFEKFISGKDPTYKFPENFGFRQGFSFKSPVAKDLGNPTPCSPDNNYICVYVENAATGNYVAASTHRFGEKFGITWINPGTYNVTVMGTDGDYIYTDKKTLTFAEDEVINFDFTNFASNKIDVKLSNLGTIESTINSQEHSFYDLSKDYFTIRKLYKFSSFNEPLTKALEGKKNNYLLPEYMYNQVIDTTSHCISLETQINMSDLSVKKYQVAIVDPNLNQDSNTNCYMIDMNQINFDDFSKRLAETNTGKNECLASFITPGTLDDKFGNLECNADISENAPIAHKGLLLYNEGNQNTRIYTRLYTYNTLQQKVLDQISGRQPNARYDFNLPSNKYAIQVEYVVNYPEKTTNCYNLILSNNTSGGNKVEGYKVSGLTEQELNTFLIAPDYTLSKIPGTKNVAINMPEKTTFGITGPASETTDRLAFRITKQNEDVTIYKEVSVTFASTNEKNLEHGNYTIEIFGDDNNYLYYGKKNFTVDSSTTEVTFTSSDLKYNKYDIKDKASKFGTITSRVNPQPENSCPFDLIDNNGYVNTPMLYIYNSYNEDFKFLLSYLTNKKDNMDFCSNEAATHDYCIEIRPQINYESLKITKYVLNIKNGATSQIFTSWIDAADFDKLTSNFANIVTMKRNCENEIKTQISASIPILLTSGTVETINDNTLGLPSFNNDHWAFYEVLFASDSNLNQKLIAQLTGKQTNAGFNVQMPNGYDTKTLIQLEIMLDTNTNSVELYRFRFHDKTLHGTNYRSFETRPFLTLDELKQFLAGPDFVLPSNN